MALDIKESMENFKIGINEHITENIAYRLFSRSDIFPLYQSTLNPKFNEWLLWATPNGIADVIEQGELILREMRTGQSIAISMVEKNTGKWIGLIKFAIFKDSLVNGTWFHPDYWSKPIVIFGMSALIDIFFKTTELDKLYARHILGYSRMQKILLRNGFEYIDNDIVKHTNGSNITLLNYKVEKNDWIKYSKTDIYEY